MARNGSRVTIVDVAARAGVHPGTVSRALNRPETVAESTRRRVEELLAGGPRNVDLVGTFVVRGSTGPAPPTG